MKELIIFFNENYGDKYGNIDYPRTNIQMYQVYQIIKDLGLEDGILSDLLKRVKLPVPRNLREREMYSECINGVNINELVLPDWEEADENNPSFIKNKPFYCEYILKNILYKSDNIVYHDGTYSISNPDEKLIEEGTVYNIRVENNGELERSQNVRCSTVINELGEEEQQMSFTIGNIRFTLIQETIEGVVNFFVVKPNSDSEDMLNNRIITISSVVPKITQIDVDYLPMATMETLGVIKPGKYVTVEDGIITVPLDDYPTFDYLNNKVEEIVGLAPETLDSLQEIANAIGNDADFVNTITDMINSKVEKVDGKGLSDNNYTTDEKNKLQGIEVNANNYVHPESHEATIIIEDETHRFTTDQEKATWNNLVSDLEVSQTDIDDIMAMVGGLNG